jgi:hypothetical protein
MSRCECSFRQLRRRSITVVGTESHEALRHGAIATNTTIHDSLESRSGGRSDRMCFYSQLEMYCFSSHRRGSLIPLDSWLRGWPLVAANVVFYSYLCWLAFWFIRGSHGRERVFIVGWFSAVLLSPLEVLQHGFTLEIRYICAFARAVSLLAAVSRLLHPTGIDDSTARTAQRSC